MQSITGRYRGKRKSGAKWVYGSLVNNLFFEREGGKRVNYIFDTDILGDYDCWEDMFDKLDDLEVIPETVSQLIHTSLDGREWYAGDIAMKSFTIKDNGPFEDSGFTGYRVGEVVFDIAAGMILKGGYMVNEDMDKVDLKPGKTRPVVFSRTEIIGNRWDNPELLIYSK